MAMCERTMPSRARAHSTTALVVVVALLAIASSSGHPATTSRVTDSAHEHSEAARAVAAMMAAARDLLRPAQSTSAVLRPVMVAIVGDAGTNPVVVLLNDDSWDLFVVSAQLGVSLDKKAIFLLDYDNVNDDVLRESNWGSEMSGQTHL